MKCLRLRSVLVAAVTLAHAKGETCLVAPYARWPPFGDIDLGVEREESPCRQVSWLSETVGTVGIERRAIVHDLLPITTTLPPMPREAASVPSKKMPAKQRSRVDYVDRINRAIDYIQQHLDQPLQLEVVARVACFSPFHFHRIFQLMVGESLLEFVKRVRLERAIALMSQHGWATRRRVSLTDIALACGFASSADFSRCFRQAHGVAPSRFDVAAYREQRREAWQDIAAPEGRRYLLDRLKPGANPDGFVVKLRRLPPRIVAYIRVANSYPGDGVVQAIGRLTAWAEARGWADRQWLGYSWDNPEIVPPEHCRYDVGLEVPEMKPEGEISRMRFPTMQVAEIELRGGIDLEMRALDWIYGTWLPSSGYVPTDQPGFEAWIGRPFAHGTEYFTLRAQIPVEKG